MVRAPRPDRRPATETAARHGASGTPPRDGTCRPVWDGSAVTRWPRCVRTFAPSPAPPRLPGGRHGPPSVPRPRDPCRRSGGMPTRRAGSSPREHAGAWTAWQEVRGAWHDEATPDSSGTAGLMHWTMPCERVSILVLLTAGFRAPSAGHAGPSA